MDRYDHGSRVILDRRIFRRFSLGGNVLDTAGLGSYWYGTRSTGLT